MSTTDPVNPPGEPAPELLEGRIWVDGCWDFFHHGHAGAMLQARQLGTELYVGVHSDEAILENKGPTVMTLQERLSAVDACRWVTASVAYAPYVTQLDWISHYGCKYVVHGDDITSDSSGEDCYRFVKQAGRFKVVKRTPSISTTDLVGRMLLCTKTHFIKSLKKRLDGEEGHGSDSERQAEGKAMRERMELYATDETALAPGADVWFWSASKEAKRDDCSEEQGSFNSLFKGPGPKPGQRVVYVDGGFDLFSSGHIEFLRLAVKAEEELAEKEGWYSQQAKDERIGKGSDYGPVFVVAGVHDDEVINHWKGVNYPIMNIFERGLCVLQCRYVNAVVFGAPFTPTKPYLTSLPWGTPDAVYHGPTSFMPLTYDPYTAPKEMKIYREIGAHDFEEVNAGTIVQRIMKSRAMYEERQRKKGEKADVEAAARQREILEEEQRRREAANAA
ncbi:putative ethanolamine-phosphate cytidylyltransferase protein [Phaeoacremonium minimum UCRPA7]|uniref:ethanolamine-phosphate cytidylyltransferase n=1 Tax=Phaeoacremonium minimum (strain UCR-PA7) TaxID=1286976 RepID=R8BVS8_PHAM7|nr:putative ethanolamine-phosphate cytidylyltransferase protein [Phaeoacremonium minimum UCRPA7]EOO03496.1 putative ethanolamine-phosphate cytidylyltransferase protein [Phaeoacremonium minimum UCRPA7]